MIRTYDRKCTGCRICETICSLEHYGTMSSALSRIRVRSKWPWEERVHICRQCKNAKCIEACGSKEALTLSDYLIVHEEKCDLCMECVRACPFDAIWIDPGHKADPERKLLVCDTCGGEYLCSKWCPVGVIVERCVSRQ